MIFRGIGRYRVKPSVKSTFATKIGQCPIGADKRILRDVLRLGVIVHIARDDREHLVLILSDQRIECRLLASLNAPHQFKIGLCLTHAQRSGSGWRCDHRRERQGARGARILEKIDWHRARSPGGFGRRDQRPGTKFTAVRPEVPDHD